MFQRKNIIVSLLALLTVAVFGVGSASAQCNMPDNLEGPCCTAASVDLPIFPDTNDITRYVCWRNCAVNFNANVRVQTQHNSIACGYSLIRFDITNVGGSVDIWGGNLISTYSRTWMEISPTSTVPNTQVWRFLVNGDFTIDPFIVTTYGANTCVVPPSYFTYNRILVTGYIDYAFNCDTNTWSTAFALGHECDAFEHDNAFSDRPGTFGNLKTYNWVGPSAGFVLDPSLPVAEGDILNDGMRDFDFTVPLPDICRAKQPVAQGAHFVSSQFCRCTNDTTVPPQITVSRLSSVSLCNSSAASVTVDVWPGLLSKSIGSWTDPGVYPGVETLHLQQGFFQYTEGCAGDMFRYFCKGAHTQGGYETFKFVGTSLVPVSDRFIDLGSAIPLSGDTSTPAVGRRYISDRMMYLNVE